MNFYLNAVDEQLRVGDDRESVGIILCTERNETVTKLAMHRMYAPIAVSAWQADTPAELAQFDEVRTRLIDRIAHRTLEIIDPRPRGDKVKRYAVRYSTIVKLSDFGIECCPATFVAVITSV